uniref:Uncharacterized protein n=1 Tax=Octopus bimaculoides TaxID=37653 RepID=A0A0L8HGI1_OCTBM
MLYIDITLELWRKLFQRQMVSPTLDVETQKKKKLMFDNEMIWKGKRRNFPGQNEMESDKSSSPVKRKSYGCSFLSHPPL